MKHFKSIIPLFFCLFLILSCQKELNYERTSAEGSLQVDGSGNCTSFVVNGVYNKDSLLKATNFIEIQINFTEVGIYFIKSDTLNGYSFSATGDINTIGLTTIRLLGSGTPNTTGINSFTINFPTTFGSTTCRVDVEVEAPLTDAQYTIGTIGSTCSHASLSGVFSVGTPLTQANTVMIDVDVSIPGSYDISTSLVNGFSFSRSGIFATAGPQTISLVAAGTPITAGQSIFPVSGNSNSCSFPVTIVAMQNAAVFTLNTSGTACASPVVAGNYTVGTPLTALNTVSLNVNVTNVGAYSITASPPMNGITFSGSGVFTATGPQVVKLTGTGIPIASGPVTYTVSVANNTCTFSVTYGTGTPPPTGPAVYSFVGTPGFCTGAIVAGSYIVGVPLNASNTVTVQVNVTTPGTYMIASPSMYFPNDLGFTKIGTFTTTGIQNLVLPGSGTPAQVGIHQFTPSGQGPGCNFFIKSTAAVATDFIVAKIGLDNKTFNIQPSATYLIPSTKLSMQGLASSGSQESLSLEIDRSGAGGNITAMAYTNSPSGGTKLSVSYVDANGALWKTSDGSVNPIEGVLIIVTKITATSVEGMFNTTIRNNGGNGPLFKIVRDGSFSIPIQ